VTESDDIEEWDDAFVALNPYLECGPNIGLLVAMLTKGKPVPAEVADRLAKYLDGFTAKSFGYGLVVKKFSKFRLSKQRDKFLRDEAIYLAVRRKKIKFRKLEAAVTAVINDTGLSRAKVMAIWSSHRWNAKVLKEIETMGRSPTYEQSRVSKRESTISKKSRRPVSK
jgi:hypothetical protein